MNVKSITIRLSDEETKALNRSAQKDFRRPQEQVRFLVLTALGLTDDGQKNSVHTAENRVDAISINR